MLRVQVFCRSIFPPSSPGLEPDFLFFDNACSLRSHLRGCDHQGLLKRMALVVDSFHFSTHKHSNVECQQFCNPSSYPVLRSHDGAWLFNSSAAEQANVWFGKFQTRVREMNVVRSDSNGFAISMNSHCQG